MGFSHLGIFPLIKTDFFYYYGRELNFLTMSLAVDTLSFRDLAAELTFCFFSITSMHSLLFVWYKKEVYVGRDHRIFIGRNSLVALVFDYFGFRHPIYLIIILTSFYLNKPSRCKIILFFLLFRLTYFYDFYCPRECASNFVKISNLFSCSIRKK